jgi:hypothetical protein
MKIIRYKSDMPLEEWRWYLNLTKQQCKENGITFSPDNSPEPYVEIDTNEVELNSSHSYYHSTRMEDRSLFNLDDFGDTDLMGCKCTHPAKCYIYDLMDGCDCHEDSCGKSG